MSDSLLQDAPLDVVGRGLAWAQDVIDGEVDDVGHDHHPHAGDRVVQPAWRRHVMTLGGGREVRSFGLEGLSQCQ